MEGQASSIQVAFGQTQDFRANKIKVKNVYTIPTYNPSSLSSPDNIAAIVLTEPVKKTTSVTGISPDPKTKSDAYVGQDLFVCGFGVIDNDRNRTKTLQCTTLQAVPMAECTAILASMATTTTGNLWRFLFIFFSTTSFNYFSCSNHNCRRRRRTRW